MQRIWSWRSISRAAVMTVVLAADLAAIAVMPARAAIVLNGDVYATGGFLDPTAPLDDPANWVTGTNIHIGANTVGSVTVTDGSAGKGEARIGMDPGSLGTLTVDGAGSTWTAANVFSLGGNISQCLQCTNSTGILNLINGGSFGFTFNGIMSVGVNAGSTGIVNINSGGRLSDAFLSVARVPGANGIVTVDGVGSQMSAGISVGLGGTGTLKILNGAQAGSAMYSNRVGESGGTGRVILDGVGSTWSTGPIGFEVGNSGTGLVTVTNGATLANGNNASLGTAAAGVGSVMVNGAGSNMTGTTLVEVGRTGTGRLSVSDAGTFTGQALSINNNSMLTVDLGTGSTVTTTGAAGVANDGTIRLAAKASAANGTYAPISAGTWSGTGTVQALGGVYDPTTHSVTVSNAATGQAGIATIIDRSMMQRILITDGATGKQVGASFQGAIAPANLSLTASLMNNSQLSLLQGLLDPGKAILSGWDFSATGYTTGDPVYLSLQIGSGQKFYDLDVWHFDGTGWAKYLNTDLAYDNQFASFVVTGFSGYAVSGLAVAAVPVPAAVWLFGSGLATIAGFARRKTVHIV